MSIPSNLYAQKVFGEHPLAIWPLDEQVDFASILSASAADIDNSWTITTTNLTGTVIPGTVTTTSVTVGPISTSQTYQIVSPDPGVNSFAVTRLESPELSNLQALDLIVGTLTSSTWFNPISSDIIVLEIGYTYIDPTTSVKTDVVETFDISINNAWQLLSTTQLLANVNTTFKMLIKVTYKKSVTPSPTYSMLINGIALGQLAEEFTASSTGIVPLDIPLSIALPTNLKVLPTSKYGVNADYAYHIINDNLLRAKNFGVPLVYGSSSSTTLLNNYGLPSLIVPGLGFLNNDGKYRDLTLELWLRVNSGTKALTRIVGPIGSDDGLYVNDSFLTLKINDYVVSHPVSEWGRPMLINILINKNSASVLLNGERIISISLDPSMVTFPDKLNIDGKDQDWIGFYTSPEVSPIAIDCVAIYSYLVPEVVAKRRWVYGQGVEFPDNINSSYSSTAISADYAFSNYSNNYNYPENSNWSSGIVENLSVSNNMISTPIYNLPSVSFNTRTNNEWYLDIDSESLNYISLRPNSSWDNVSGHIFFNSFDIISQKIKAFYGLFKQPTLKLDKETLFRIVSSMNENYLEASITGNTLTYSFTYSGQVTILKTLIITENQYFSAGINIDTLIEQFGQNLSSFFGDREFLNVYIGGTKDFSQTFSGEIKTVNFASSFAFDAIKTEFTADGLISLTANVLDEVSSYTLVMRESVIGNRLDIRTKSYWEDYIPISYFSKYVKDSENASYYSVDLIQFNLGYPEPNTFADDLTIGDKVFDTTNSIVKTYITFQDLTTKATKPRSDFSVVIPAISSRTVEPGKYVLSYDTNGDPVYDDWKITAYEVVNNTVIYLPVGATIADISIAVQIEITTDGSAYDPVRIKSLQLASLAFNDISKNIIGSRFGIPVMPYTKLGVYEDYKRRNPFTVYKGSTPYLYLTNHSGFEVVGKPKTGVNRGLSMPINQGVSETYKVGALQIFLRFSGETFPITPIEAFEIESNSAHIKFYLVADDAIGLRGKIYGLNTTTGAIEEGLVFFINGLRSPRAIINLNEWSVLGIQFGTKLDFGYYNNSLPATKGAFRITGPLTVNNIAHFQYTAEQEQQAIKVRAWSEVLHGSPDDYVWSYWNDSFIWKNVLYLLTTEKGNIDPAQIFNIYTGTNRLVFSDEKAISISAEPYKIYKDIAWKSITQSAV